MSDDDDYQAGQAVGRDPDGSAIDCPFLPGPDLARRNRWMEGFSSVRDGVDTVKADPPPKSRQPAHSA